VLDRTSFFRSGRGRRLPAAGDGTVAGRTPRPVAVAAAVGATDGAEGVAEASPHGGGETRDSDR